MPPSSGDPSSRAADDSKDIDACEHTTSPTRTSAVVLPQMTTSNQGTTAGVMLASVQCPIPAVNPAPQFARQEAMDTFVPIRASLYQSTSLGLARQQEERMVCECQYDEGTLPLRLHATAMNADSIVSQARNGSAAACGEDSDCINRLTPVECLEVDCRRLSFCQNQRYEILSNEPRPMSN